MRDNNVLTVARGIRVAHQVMALPTGAERIVGTLAGLADVVAGRIAVMPEHMRAAAMVQALADLDTARELFARDLIQFVAHHEGAANPDDRSIT